MPFSRRRGMDNYLPLIGLPVWQIPLIPTISSNTPQLRIKYNNWKGNLKFAQEKKRKENNCVNQWSKLISKQLKSSLVYNDTLAKKLPLQYVKIPSTNKATK